MWHRLGLLIVATLLGHEAALAQDSFAARQGLALARQLCVGCHGIVPGAPSVAAGAPNFEAIAGIPGMSPLALRVALQTPHHSMPNLVLTPDELQHVTAYITGLRSH